MRRLTREIVDQPAITDGHFNALAMLVTDASLTGDGATLEAAQRGLQWLFHRHPGSNVSEADRSETRGRLLGLIDAAHWALQRLPSGLQLGLDPNSHAARFLVAVARQPGLSNQDLALRLGVDETEVSRVGRRLLSSGVVWRRREWRSNAWDVTPRGRRYLENSPLAEGAEALSGPRADLMLTHAIGVKVLPTEITGVLVGRGARQMGEAVVRHFTGPVDVVAATTVIAELVRSLVATNPHIGGPALGLGVEIGGHVQSETGVVVNAPGYTGDWNGAPLGDRLRQELRMPVIVDNDANALAVYERGFGDLTGVDNAAAVLVSDGVGCGVIVNGSLVHGVHGSAGELGHLPVPADPGVPGEPVPDVCRAGHHGCLEAVAGMTTIVERIRSSLSPREVPDLHDAMKHAEKDWPASEQTFRRAGTAVGASLAGLQNLLNPSRIVVYSPEGLQPDDKPIGTGFNESMLQAMRVNAFSTAFDDCEVTYKRYAAVDGARAAAAMALLRLTVMD
ncbi:ROK family transcriptional regulator [Actinoplanes sp. NPDC051411]|uniref:ROK family transcriptional regulator n=1 Tax=Actinoplanes sp. NPDC051411 TaxID=3155522 RepID=UPI00341201C8